MLDFFPETFQLSQKVKDMLLRIFEMHVHDTRRIIITEGTKEKYVKFLLQGKISYYRLLPSQPLQKTPD
jgi:hypothetical protein